MTDDMMTLRARVEKTPDADLLRGMIGFAAGGLMEPEAGAATGAACGSKDPSPLAQRSDYRVRDWETRAGTVELCVPSLRTGPYFPGFLEPRRMAESEPTNTPGSRERANADGARHCPWTNGGQWLAPGGLWSGHFDPLGR